MARLNWEQAKAQQRVGSAPRLARVRGISNAQAKELARLQRRLSVPYSGNGMTSVEASQAIKAARADLARISDGQRAWRAAHAQPE
jgi:hypothetical protein